MSSLYEAVLQQAENLKGILESLASEGSITTEELSPWINQLNAINDAVSGRVVRIAVVGAVKSGKSTLVNAFLGEDLLKRGAGIVTSCVTRVRTTGGEKGGWVEFKSWEEVNRDITNIYNGLRLLNQEGFPHKDSLDIRNEADREIIRKFLEQFREYQKPGDTFFDPYTMMLHSYLEGYRLLGTSCLGMTGVTPSVSEGSPHEPLQNVLEPDTSIRRIFNELNLHEHQFYVGSDHLWVFTKDIEIFYPAEWLGDNVEIADCQGGDSPNPVHFAILQDYLIRCHCVVYVVQSRVGLRNADFRILSLIKKLGLMPMTAVVINIDMGEHESVEDFEKLRSKVKEDLAWFGQENVPVYGVAALPEMVRALGERANPSEQEKTLFWARRAPELYGLSKEEFTALKEHIRKMVESGAEEFLSGCRSRLRFLTAQICNALQARHHMLTMDAQAVASAVEDLARCRDVLKATLDTFEKAVSEFAVSAVDEAKHDVSKFFDPESSPLVGEVLDAIESYQCQVGDDIGDIKYLPRKLYEFYLEVRNELARIIAERANGMILDFAREQEKIIAEKLEQTFQTFMSVFKVAFEGYQRTFAEKLSLDIKVASYDISETWKPPQDLYPPSLAVFVQGEPLGKTTLLLKFSIGRAIESLARLRDKLGRRRSNKRPRNFYGKRLQNEAAQLVKSEVQAEVMEVFDLYADKFTKEYLLPLIDDGIKWLVREIRLHAETSMIDFHHVVEMSRLRGEERERQIKILEDALTHLGKFS
jgi:hypothetical protein